MWDYDSYDIFAAMVGDGGLENRCSRRPVIPWFGKTEELKKTAASPPKQLRERA